MSKITAKYLIETSYPLEKAAEIMAGEQSCGTFVKVAGESAELREKFLAKTVKIEDLIMAFGECWGQSSQYDLNSSREFV